MEAVTLSMVLGWSGLRSECGYRDEVPEPQRTLFSRAEFTAEELVKLEGRDRKPQPRPCSIGRSTWSRSGRRSWSARDARPGYYRGSHSFQHDGCLCSSMYAIFCVSAQPLVHVGGQP